MPISGLNAQRLVPMLTSLVLSYWLHGGDTRRLTPTIRSCSQSANSFAVNAGAPYRLTDSRKAGLPKPSTLRSTGSPL